MKKTLIRFLTLCTMSLFSLNATAYFCDIGGAPTTADVPADEKKLYVSTHPIFGDGGAIISAVQETNELTLMLDVKLYIPAPVNDYVYSSQLSVHPLVSEMNFLVVCDPDP